MRLRCSIPLLAAALAGCAHRHPATGETPPPAPISAAEPAPRPVPARDSLALCAIKDGELVEVKAERVLETGDTLIGDRPFSQLFPLTGEYAATAQWYVDNLPFTFRGACYIKYGRPRHLALANVRRVGTHRGLALFADEPDVQGRPPILYVLVRPCEFQSYQYELVLRPCEVRARWQRG